MALLVVKCGCDVAEDDRGHHVCWLLDLAQVQLESSRALTLRICLMVGMALVFMPCKYLL